MKLEDIRILDSSRITDAVEELFVKANSILPKTIERAINDAYASESSKVGKSVLNTLMDNLNAARDLDIPICQDTGMAVVFAEIGYNVHISGGSLEEAINEGVRRAYVGGNLRLSIVDDPLYDRVNTKDNTPAVIHIQMSSDEKLANNIVITAAPKGFGSENMSALKMMTPSADEEDVVSFVLDTVKKAGANPCPPIFVGVGIGGNFETCALLAKKALLRDSVSSDVRYAKLEERIKKEINKTGIGPQGFGGDTTALNVMIEHAPTHIAGLPVAVNINCHVSRHATAVL